MLIGMVRHRAVIWGRTAGLVAFVGLINLSGLLLVDWFAIALGQSGLPVADAVGILERPRRIAAALSYVGWKTLRMDDGVWAGKELTSPPAPTS